MESDYDPHEHREKSHPTTNLETFFHLLKGNLGTGVLALPEAFEHAGLLIGTIFTIIITFIITYSLHLLFHGMYFLCKKNKVPQMPYSEALKEGLLLGPNCLKVFANAAPAVVNFFIVVNQVGVCCVYVVFSASNLKQVIDQMTNVVFTLETYMVFLLLPLLFITYVRNLKYLVPFSTVANWILIIGCGIILHYVFAEVGPISDRKLVQDLREFPLFMGTALFTVLCVGVILSVEANMKQPKSWLGWCGILSWGMIILTVINLAVAFGGYWKYGAETEPSITLNLPNEPLAQCVKILFATAMYISFALQCYPATELLWDQYLVGNMETSKHHILWEYVLRTILVLFIFLLSTGIPRLGLFISLFGAFCLSTLGVIFPPVLDICIRWPENLGKCRWILYKNMTLILFGILGLIFGTYTSIYEIVKSLL